MANLLCVVELLQGRALPVSLEVLGQSRRLATELGATLYAVVALPRAPSWSDDDLVSTLAAHGADKVVIATDETLGGGEELRWGTHGAALAAVCDLLSPSLLLFGATPTAREVAARAAARIGAAFLHEAWVEAADGELVLFEGSGAEARTLEGELEFAVVATVPAGRYTTALGDDEAEVEVVATSGRGADFDEIGSEADTRPPAAVLVGDEARAAGESLARALGGEIADGRIDARLAISLGPPCPASGAAVERRVRLGGSGSDDADYVVAGDPAALAEAFARAVSDGNGAAAAKAGSKSEGKK
ncbi:MAG: electron transfer flavoprotein, alpha subunit [bacterium]|nr:electron transfer flavoprotein, alpha subunit [bacterium]